MVLALHLLFVTGIYVILACVVVNVSILYIWYRMTKTKNDFDRVNGTAYTSTQTAH